MFELNLNPYDTEDYYESELKIAKRNLKLVTEAATARIKNATDETACDIATEMSEAIMCATHQVRVAESNFKRFHEKESN